MNGTPVTAPTESTSDAPRCSRRCRLAVLLVLFLLPLGLRLWSIDHGSPRNYVEDTHIVKNALGMAKDQTIAPPVNKYSSYPNLLPYMLLTAASTGSTATRTTSRSTPRARRSWRAS